MIMTSNQMLSKVPEVTLIFWLVKVAATTLGETAGDAVTMSLNLGYLIGTLIFAVACAGAIAVQVRSTQFHPLRYWVAIVTTTTVGTTLADYATRSLGIGYTGGSALLLGLLIISFIVWARVAGKISVAITNPRAEICYWITITLSQTLGTALGDWMADTNSFGYLGSAVVFSTLLVVIAALHFFTRTPKAILFWSAFVLTRPLGAVVGDFLDKPLEKGGLELDRFVASGVLLLFMIVCLVLARQKASKANH
jgi:uncharacterized membrane-anchored protein